MGSDGSDDGSGRLGEAPARALLSRGARALHKVAEQFERDGYALGEAGLDGSEARRTDWEILWSYAHPFGGKRPVAPDRLRAGQTVNHFPDAPFVEKLLLAKRPLEFIPRAFDLPNEMAAFAAAYREHPEKRWVRKNTGHRGVRLSSPHEAELAAEEADEAFFVQEFVQPPHLLCGRKWDVGVYVLLTSLDPLRVYAYPDIALRFCPKDFPPTLDPTDVGTYVVADDYTSPWELAGLEPHREGDRTAVEILRSALADDEPALEWREGLPVACLGAIHDVVTQDADAMLARCRPYPSGQHHFFELYRFDFVFDDRLEAHLMEVNLSPNLDPGSDAGLDDRFTRIVRDTFALVGIRAGSEMLRARCDEPERVSAHERSCCPPWIPITQDMSRPATPRKPAPPNAAPIPEPAASCEEAAIRFSLHGACIEVVLPGENELRALRERLPPGIAAESRAAPDVSYRASADVELFRGGELRHRAQSMDELLNALVSDLHFQLACHARSALYVHAGVVATGGRAIVIPGRSHSGKSTLVAALVRAGATYYSDEYAVLDTDGRVHPYLKPISLRDAEGIAHPHAVADLGGRNGSEPVPVGLIVHTQYEPTASWAPHPLDTAAALLALVDNTVRAREKPVLMLEVLTRVVGRADAIGGKRGEAAQAVDELLGHAALSGETAGA